MKLGSRCTVCGGSVVEADTTRCIDCRRRLHAPCEPYETAFECRECGEDRWVGAVEF